MPTNDATPTAPTGTGPAPSWAADLTREASGYGFNVGEMADSSEVPEVERYEDEDGEDMGGESEGV